MDDCCWVSVTVHPDDLNTVAWKKWIKEQGPSEDDTGVCGNYWYRGEAPWALWAPLETLAEGCVRFTGELGSQADWGAQIFFHDNSGDKVQYAPADTWECSSIVVSVPSQSKIDHDALDKQMLLLRRYWDLNRSIIKCQLRTVQKAADASREMTDQSSTAKNTAHIVRGM